MDSQKDKPMNFRNRIIGIQLRLGFGVQLFFVSVPEAIADLKTDNAKDLKNTGLK
jgi:hypothetical protein